MSVTSNTPTSDTAPPSDVASLDLSQELLQLINLIPWFNDNALTSQSPMYTAIALGCIGIISLTLFLTIKWICRSSFFLAIFDNTYQWDDALLEHGVFSRLGHLVPGVFIYLCTPLLLPQQLDWVSAIQKGTLLYLLLASTLAVFAILNTLETLYDRSKLAEKAPITGFVQVTKLVVAIICILLVISLLLDRSPWLLLSGLTAVAAVLLLIFRDTILGFVAGIQIAANRMFNTGDWIEIPKFDIDGEILEIGLNVVKVQNWDKTIATIPTYSLTNESVRNWQGMQRSGGRRIKRALHVDQRSIQFLEQEQLEALKQVRFINAYLARKLDELQRYHNDQSIAQNDLVNMRRLTNIGTFRAYANAYLQSHPKVHPELTLMVRQLKPSEVGIPLEIYCFTNTTAWVEYEGIQADIFDHLLAIMPVFGLSAYQRISDVSPQPSNAPL